MRLRHLTLSIAATALIGASIAAAAKPKSRPTEHSADGVDAPPAPLLSPAESLAAFKIQKGFRIELVAAEPLIGDPVTASFDADGRLWVVEMRDYMPDAQGTGEKTSKAGRIVVLDDLDGDGRMDKSTVFLEGLVLPRAVMPFRRGVLVAEPPFLYFYRDNNGDGKPDQKSQIAMDYGSRTTGNPEHMPNAPTYGLDNWIHSANYTTAFRYEKGMFQTRPEAERGQWGLSQDDWGRLYFNTNSNYLRADLISGHYAGRNRNIATRLAGLNVEIDADQQVFPQHVGYAINRAYQPNILREDGKLRNFTATCSPLVYRGGLFPEEFAGDVFVPEPAAQFIRRSVIKEDGYHLKGDNAYEKEKTEFLTTDDEWFRPVHLTTGPEGAMYVVDMHRGIIQHKTYLTPYLKQLLLERGLDKPIGLGRIYRIVPENTPLPKTPKLSTLSATQLVERLADSNGFIRDTAQRLLVEKRDNSTIEPLREMAQKHTDPRAVVHALWTLEGLGAVDVPSLLAVLKNQHPHARANALRVAEPFLAKPDVDPALLAAVLPLAKDANSLVRVQFALSVTMDHPGTGKVIADLLSRDAKDPVIRSAVVNSAEGRELQLLEMLLSDPAWKKEEDGRANLLLTLAGAVLREGEPDHVLRLLDWMAREDEPGWRRNAMLDGWARRTTTGPRRTRPNDIVLKEQPATILSLMRGKDEAFQKKVQTATAALQWPGKPRPAGPKLKPLTPEETALFKLGKEEFINNCAVCHQPDGAGMEGKAPSLIQTPWVLGSDEQLIRILLHGLAGPIKVDGETWDSEMPAWSVLDDEKLAGIATYVRREWDNTADPVSPKRVAEIRKRDAERAVPWTDAELRPKR